MIVPKLVFDQPLAKLWHADAQDMSFLPDASVQLVVTSPPYNLGVSGSTSWPSWNMQNWYADDLPEETYQQQQLELLNQLYRILADGGSLLYNHKLRQNNMKSIHPCAWLLKSNFNLVQEIIWNRGSTLNHSPAFLWPLDERIFWMSKGKPRYFNPQSARLTTIWTMNFQSATWHPAPFPEELAERCINAFSQPGDTVLDPYSGSGTTVRVAKRLGRIGIGLDVDADYLTRSAESMQNLTLVNPNTAV